MKKNYSKLTIEQMKNEQKKVLAESSGLKNKINIFQNQISQNQREYDFLDGMIALKESQEEAQKEQKETEDKPEIVTENPPQEI